MSKKLRVGTLFSGICAFEHALKRLNILNEIVFACDNDKYCKEAFLQIMISLRLNGLKM